MSEKGGENSLSADFYYSKALEYLSMAQDDDQSPYSCQNCHSDEEEDDDDFSLGFRRQITQDHVHGSASSSGSEATRASPTEKSEKLRQRRHSVIERPKISEEFGKPLPKRKLSDGHVHWADEFQKELTRSHPRKTYTRHPSHVTAQVKPILKSSPEEEDYQELREDDS